MEDLRLFDAEYRLVWEHQPINSTALSRLCQEKLGWKKSTTFNLVRKLGERGILKNENATVTALVSKEEVQLSQMEEMMEKTFEGSLPAFLAAFARRQALSQEEEEEIRRIIEK